VRTGEKAVQSAQSCPERLSPNPEMAHLHETINYPLLPGQIAFLAFKVKGSNDVCFTLFLPIKCKVTKYNYNKYAEHVLQQYRHVTRL
jgi:hypothetical protein